MTLWVALAPLLLAALLLWLGSRILRRTFLGEGWGEERRLRRIVYAAFTGALALHLWLTLLGILGIAWSAFAIVSFCVAGIALTYFWAPAPGPRGALPSDLGWGDGVALACALLFALLSITLWITTPDFVYHWGLKGARFFLVGGIDFPYLAKAWNWAIHPDYPNLFPELFAATALLARRFDPPSLMTWTSLAFALLLASCRVVLAERSTDRFTRQAGLALLALVLTAFGIGHQIASAADWLSALALAAAVPALLRPPDRDGDLEVSLSAAFAAAVKIEGVPLAFFLLAVQALRRVGRERRLDYRSLAVLALPTLLVVAPWWWQAHRFHLFQPFNSGRFELARARLVGVGLKEVLALRAWHGFGVLVFAAPLLLFRRATRAFAVVATLQLAFFFYVYFTAPVGTTYYVISSFPRLSLQLIPALLAVLVGEVSGKREPQTSLSS